MTGLIGQYRLVTVTGPGGVGKTRLAGQVAALARDGFADGVWLAELAAVREPGLVPAAVASAVGLRQEPGRDLTDSMTSLLSQRQMLLLLDNCEHLLGAVAELCGRLLPAADDMKVLATSREPTGVAGEVRYRLAPLALPATGDPADVAKSEAVMLFAERAMRADPRASLDLAAVARIVARLDGMPLAIELAAARAEALGVTRLAGRLDDRLLTVTGRSAPERHRSLAATADWSYLLLQPSERRVFRMLGVFPGPFTLDAAGEVAGPDAGAAVLHLVDCSLLTPPQSGPDGRDRYVMLQTLRGYAAERLAQAGEEEAAMTALAAYALRTAQAAAAELERSGTELAAAALLDAEDATMHQALTWALEHDPATGLALATALAPWWSLRGRFTTGYRLLSQASTADAAGSGPGWSAAQVWLGRLATGTDEAAGLAHFSAARDALRSRPGQAAQAGESARLLVQALAGCADCLLNQGQIGGADDQASQALALADEIGYPEGRARAMLWLGACAYYAGNHRACLDWWRRAQRIDQRAIPGNLVRRSTIFLAAALFDADELDQARAYCATALSSAGPAGALFDLADATMLMANIDLRAGAVGAAGVWLRDAITLAREVGSDLLAVDCLDAAGHWCAQAARHREAITLWAAMAAARQAGGLPDPPKDSQRRAAPLRQARHSLGPDRARHAEARGTAMTLRLAAEYAALLVAGQAAEPELEPEPEPAAGRLSARERELIRLVAQGRTNNEIAAQLFISVRTVTSHLDRIRDKTGCRRRADLTRLALRINLI